MYSILGWLRSYTVGYRKLNWCETVSTEQLVILPSRNSASTKTGGPVVKMFAYGSQRNIRYWSHNFFAKKCYRRPSSR